MTGRFLYRLHSGAIHLGITWVKNRWITSNPTDLERCQPWPRLVKFNSSSPGDLWPYRFPNSPSLFLFLPCPPLSKHLHFDRSGNFHLADWRVKLLLVRHTDSCPALPAPSLTLCYQSFKGTSPIILILQVSRPLKSPVWALCVSSNLSSLAPQTQRTAPQTTFVFLQSTACVSFQLCTN